MPENKRKLNCKVRCFYSKGAGLIIVWNFLLNSTLPIVANFSLRIIYLSMNDLIPGLGDPRVKRSVVQNCAELILIFSGFLSILFIGWLADSKFGNYRILKFSLVIVYFTYILACILTLFFENTESTLYKYKYVVIVSLVFYFVNLTVAVFFSTANA